MHCIALHCTTHRYVRSLSGDGGSLAVLDNCTAEVRGFAETVKALLEAAGLSSHMQVIANVMAKPYQHLLR